MSDGKIPTEMLVVQLEHARLALNRIRDMHLGDCPASTDELSHARTHIVTIRTIAHEALLEIGR